MSPEKNNYPTKFDNTNFYGFVILLVSFWIMGGLAIGIGNSTLIPGISLLLIIGIGTVLRKSRLKKAILTRRYDDIFILLTSVLIFASVLAYGSTSVTYFQPPCFKGFSAFLYSLEQSTLFFLLYAIVALIRLALGKYDKIINGSKYIFTLILLVCIFTVIYQTASIFIGGDDVGPGCGPVVSPGLIIP